MHRLALLTNMVAPYRVPFFRALAQQDDIGELRVLTCVDREADRQWRVANDDAYTVKRLSGVTLNLSRGKSDKRILHLRFGVVSELILRRPDVLVIGDASWTSFIAAFASRCLAIPYVVWNEVTTTSRVSEGITSWLRRRMYKSARRCIASCAMARDFLLANGVDPQDINVVNNAVDNDFFAGQRVKWEPERERLRRELKIGPDTFCFIFVGQLIHRKRILETIELLADVNRSRPVHLLVVGSGPLEETVGETAQRCEFDSMSLCGFAEGERLCQLYVASDALILLSDDEPWGMVINESLLMRRPFFVSSAVAAGVELIGTSTSNIVSSSANRNDLRRLAVSFIDQIKSCAHEPSYGYGPKDMAKGFSQCL